VRVVLLAPGRLHRKEDLSAVMTVFHVQKEKSVMRQVIFSTSLSFDPYICFLVFVFEMEKLRNCSFITYSTLLMNINNKSRIVFSLHFVLIR